MYCSTLPTIPLHHPSLTLQSNIVKTLSNKLDQVLLLLKTLSCLSIVLKKTQIIPSKINHSHLYSLKVIINTYSSSSILPFEILFLYNKQSCNLQFIVMHNIIVLENLLGRSHSKDLFCVNPKCQLLLHL